MDDIIRLISILLFLATSAMAQTCVSPTSSCDCFTENGKTIINCRYKSLTEIPSFNNTGQVYDEIRFTGTCPPYTGCNNIKQIGANAFANLKVRKIDLLNNPVTTIDNDAFNGLAPELEAISLQGDGSNDIPYQALPTLDEHLKTLHFENYGTQNIQFPIVLPFPNLESLTLKNWTNLDSINADVFNIMQNLKEFKLITLPSLTTLPVPALQKFLKLTSIDIMNTGIRAVYGDTFTPMSMLSEIKIRNNIYLSSIDQRAFSGVTDTVAFLEVDNNKLDDALSLEFLRNENWLALSHLNIGYNYNLRNLPNGIFSKTPNLAYLTCQDIRLTSLNKDMFTGLTKLHTLDLAYNEIKTISAETFKYSPTLVELRLHDQHTYDDLLNIQVNAFSGIETSLEILSLFNNKLNVSQFWNDVSMLSNLLMLEVMNTGIDYIPDKAFRNNKKLTDLHMADNNISSIKQETFFGPKDTLQNIDLRRNLIQTIDQCTLSDFPSKPKMALAENPLNCNCDLVWLYDWFKLQSDQALVSQDIGACSSPPSLANKLFTEFTRNEMCASGASVVTCPDLYATTTTSTTTSTTTTTTTERTTTPPLPGFELLINNRGTTFIEVTWGINDMTHVTGLKIEMISNYQETKVYYPGVDAKSYQFYQLRSGTAYTFCLVLKIELVYRDERPYCKQTETLTHITDPQPSTTTLAPESDPQIGVIVGGAVGGTVLVALIIVILVFLLKSNKPKKQKPLTEPVSFTMKADVPHAGGTARRFNKKVEKEGATPDDINITVISNGEMNNQGRISAGSYQALNEKGIDLRPMPSSHGHYTNSVEDRPLPNAPYGSKGATGRGYVNTGFKNSADHIPETSTNDYSEVRY